MMHFDKNWEELPDDVFADALRGAMKDATLEPSENAWNVIQAKLAQKRRRRLFVWWSSVTSVIVLLVVGGYLLPLKSDTPNFSSSAEVTSIASSKPKTVPLKSLENYSYSGEINSPQSILNHSPASATPSKADLERPNEGAPVLKSSKIYRPKANKELAIRKQLTGIQFEQYDLGKTQGKCTGLPLDSSLSGHADKGANGSKGQRMESPQLTPYAQPSPRLDSSENLSPLSYLKSKLFLLGGGSDQAKPLFKQPKPLSETGIKPNDALRKASRFFLQYNASTAIGYRDLRQSNITELRNQIERGRLVGALGLQVGYKVSQRWSISTGIGLSTMGDRLKYGVSNRPYDQADTLVGISKTGGDTYLKTGSSFNRKNVYRYFDVPLLLEYRFPIKGSMVHVSGGLSYSALLSADAMYFDSTVISSVRQQFDLNTGGVTIASSATYDGDISYYNVLSSQLNVALEIPMGNNASLMMGPSVRYSLTPASVDGPSNETLMLATGGSGVKVHPYSVGFQVGLRRSLQFLNRLK